MSQTQLLISRISHICQKICDLKDQTKPKSIIKPNMYNTTCLDEGDRTDWSYTQEPGNSSSTKKDSDGEDGWDDTCSSHSIQHPHSPNNPHNSEHHAPSPPSLNPAPAGSILMPPGDCQEIGLVIFMFFFELLFSYVSLAISLYVSFTNLFSIIYSLIC